MTRFYAPTWLSATLGFSMVFASASAAAQEAPSPGTLANSPLIGKLTECTAIADEVERLACFDREVSALVAASREGEVRVVDTQDIKQARKQLYGYNVPDVGILAAASEEEREESKRLVSTITKVRQVSGKLWEIWIEEGNARWQLRNESIRFRAPQIGDEVEFSPATMGTYWVRINGRKGVRGNRVG